MPILTPREREILTDRSTDFTRAEHRIAVKKLKTFQESVTSKGHEVAIRGLIPAAEQIAKNAEAKGRSFDLVFHREMNRRSKAAGLRI